MTEQGPKDRPERPAAKVRDMPAPRKTRGIVGPAMRFIFSWPYRLALAGLYRSGVRPWQLTVASLATNVVVGWLLLTDRRFLPGALLVPAGLFDIFDGGVARLRGEERRSGAFLDSVFDRISDMVLFGCLYWSLAGQGRGLEAGLALATLVIALLVSHIRAEAESAGVSLTEGFFQRLERYLAMMIGLIVPGALLPALAVLVALGGVTVLQRGWSAARRLAGRSTPVG
ncbi:MAG TPA: CDP-alcohol phosphatidyltransferase family protein [Actinomycetota bacterium]